MFALRLPQAIDCGGGLVNVLGSWLPCWVKIFVYLIFYGPNQKWVLFVIKTTGTWVRWNLGLGVISVPPNSCTQALTQCYLIIYLAVILGETPILSHSFYWEWRCCVAARAVDALYYEVALNRLHIYI